MNSIVSPRAQYGYIPGLNGIRALAVLIVVIAHMGLSHIVPGGFGVTVFFFVSGFLITRLLIAEHDKNGNIGLKQFYIRRLIRLYPALLFMVFGTVLAYGLLGWGGPMFGELFSAVFYGTNIYQVGARIGGELPFMPWTHLWSLAVEEHFYLIFPAFLILFNGRWPQILNRLVIVIAVILLWRIIIYTQTSLPEAQYTEMMTDTRIDSLVWGCVLSVWLHVKEDMKRLSWLLGYWPVAIAFAAILASFLIRDEAFRYTVRYTVQGLALFTLFLNLFFSKKFRGVISILEWKPLAWVGVMSYGLYLWHVPIIDMCIRILGESVQAYLLGLPASILMASLSYYVIEKRFLGFRKAFGSHGIDKGPVKTKMQRAIERALRSTS